MLKEKAREFHYDRVVGHNYRFQAIASQIQKHFETLSTDAPNLEYTDAIKIYQTIFRKVNSAML